MSTADICDSVTETPKDFKSSFLHKVKFIKKACNINDKICKSIERECDKFKGESYENVIKKLSDSLLCGVDDNGVQIIKSLEKTQGMLLETNFTLQRIQKKFNNPKPKKVKLN